MGNCIIAGARGSQGIVPSRIYSRRGSMESISPEIGTKHATHKQMIRYYRCIQEIEKTSTGIVNLFNDALDTVDKTDEFKTILQSLQTRLFDLHQNLLLLFKLSIYKIDFSVHERKDLGKRIEILVKELWADIKETLEGNPFAFHEIEKKIENLVEKTGDLTKII